MMSGINRGLARGRVALMLLALVGFAGPAAAQSEASPTVLITGANRGIGFELARQYTEKGWHVIATCRDPEDAEALKAVAAEHGNLVIEKLDVTDEGQIDALAAKYADTPIDVLLNNAGISGGRDTQTFGEIDYDAFDLVMHTNVLGPLRMAEAFIGNVERSNQKKIVNISSTQGSIAMTFGGSYFYRASKAALNMVMRTLSIEVKGRGIIVGLLTPGIVATDFTSGLTGVPMIEPEESARLLIVQIDRLTLERSGMLIRQTGKDVPW